MKMSLIIKTIGALCVLAITNVSIYGQGCAQLPAPCPNTGSISETMDVANRTKDNNVLPQEIKMENRLRNLLTDEVQRVARANKWSVYELNEEGDSGPPYIFISYSDWEATPYNKRPPHEYQIGFIFITNKDLLHSWKNWLLNDVKQQENQLAQQNNPSQPSPLMQQYQDSINHYTQLYTDFVQKNNAAFLKDIQSNNQKGIEAYHNKEKALMDKVDTLEEKYNKAQLQSAATTNYNNFMDEYDHKTVAFAKGSLVLVHFDINPAQANFALQDAEQVSILPQHPIHIPGAYYAGTTTNNAKDNRHNYELNYRGFVFNNPSSIGTVLFGKYISKDSYNNYPATFARNYGNKQNVIGRVKAIPCDQVQTLVMHVEGSQSSVDKVMSVLDWSKLSQLLYKP